jgi:uncharacterized protein (TIGR02569 family)
MREFAMRTLRAMPSAPPPPTVLCAFELDVAAASPQLVPGGQGTTYRADGIALKPCDEPEEAEWLGSVLSQIEEDGFRIARPVRSRSGRFVVEGWCAYRWMSGETDLRGRWNESIAAIWAFSRALRDVPEPELLDRRQNVFAVADRMAWGEVPMGEIADSLGPDGRRLIRHLRPVTAPAQLIHGDPSEGNLLFAPRLPPAVIDVAPYWHPAEYAIAMFVADAIAWSRAPAELLSAIQDVPEMDQFLARAVLFRLLVARLWRGGDEGVAARSSAYAPVIEAINRWGE